MFYGLIASLLIHPGIRAYELEFSSLDGRKSVMDMPSLIEDGFIVLGNSIDSIKINRLAESIAACVERDGDSLENFSVRSSLDGSLRATLASKSNEPFDDCGKDTRYLTEYFKSQTQRIGTKVASLLDRVLFDVSDGNGVLTRIVDDLSSDSLDHFHVYSSHVGEDGTHLRNSTTTAHSVPYHYDMGLFLILTPEIWVGDSSHGGSSELIVKKRDGSEIRVSPSGPDSTIILLGSALKYWLQPKIPVNACLHAVNAIPSTDRKRRVVLGRMFLPSMEMKSLSGVTFRDFFLSPLLREEPENSERRQWRRLTESECHAGTKQCWMQCMPDIDCGDQESVCRDPVENRDCVPDECNERCALMCPERPVSITPISTERPVQLSPSLPADDLHQPAGSVVTSDSSLPNPVFIPQTAANMASQDPKFCYGATSMVMSGFQSVSSDFANCIILFFRPWLLDTPLKFALGCVGVFFLGLIVEAAIRFRRYVTNDIRFSKLWMREAAVTSLFAVNVTLGYLAMLAAMTFNVEIFVSTVMGLAIGHVVLGNSRQPVRETADPCCVTTEAAEPATLDRTGLRNSTGACCCDQ